MGRKGLIRFRCWYCNRKHVAGWDQVGVRRVCNCGERYRVPRNPGIAWRDKSLLDRLIEFVVYGFGGGLLGFCIGLVLRAKVFVVAAPGSSGFLMASLMLTAALTMGGFLVGGLLGTLFGERGINWIGVLIRGHEDDARWSS